MVIELYKRVSGQLSGWPDELLTALLVLAAVVFVLAAFRGPPLLKALLVALLVI